MYVIRLPLPFWTFVITNQLVHFRKVVTFKLQQNFVDNCKTHCSQGSYRILISYSATQCFSEDTELDGKLKSTEIVYYYYIFPSFVNFRYVKIQSKVIMVIPHQKILGKGTTYMKFYYYQPKISHFNCRTRSNSEAMKILFSVTILRCA